MKKAAKVTLTVIGILVFLGIIYYFFFGTQQSIIFLNSENTYFQYSGVAPLYKYSYGYLPGTTGLSNQCQEDKALWDNNITFSPTQVIKVGNNVYEFATSNVKQGKSSTSMCSFVVYDVAVKKNGQVIKTIELSQKSFVSCSDFEAVRPQAQIFDDITATFGFASEFRVGDGNFCGFSDYVIHRYVVNPPEQEPVETNSSYSQNTSSTGEVSASPDNTAYVNPTKLDTGIVMKTILFVVIVLLLIITVVIFVRRRR